MTRNSSEHRTLTLPITWSCPIWDLYLFNVETVFSDFEFRTPLVTSILLHIVFAIGQKETASQVNFAYRNIDDVLSINNSDFENLSRSDVSHWAWDQRHSGEEYFCFLLWFDPTNLEERSTSRSPLQQMCLNFSIVKCLLLGSNIPSSPAYGVCVSRVTRYARAFFSYEWYCFLGRCDFPIRFLGKDMPENVWNRLFRKFFGRYGKSKKIWRRSPVVW